MPTRCAGCWLAPAPVIPTPAATGSVTPKNTCSISPSLLALAITCSPGVLMVITISNFSLRIFCAMVFAVAMSPSGQYRLISMWPSLNASDDWIFFSKPSSRFTWIWFELKRKTAIRVILSFLPEDFRLCKSESSRIALTAARNKSGLINCFMIIFISFTHILTPVIRLPCYQSGLFA